MSDRRTVPYHAYEKRGQMIAELDAKLGNANARYRSAQTKADSLQTEIERLRAAMAKSCEEGREHLIQCPVATDRDCLKRDNERLKVELEKTREQGIAEGRIVHKCNLRIEELEAQCESLQNKCATRGLSPEDSDALQADNKRLQAERSDLRQRCAVISSGSPPAGWEALALQDMWDVCFGAALLAVQAELREDEDGNT